MLPPFAVKRLFKNRAEGVSRTGCSGCLAGITALSMGLACLVLFRRLEAAPFKNKDQHEVCRYIMACLDTMSSY